MRHIFEHCGVLMQAQYDLDVDGVVNFQSVRMLGDNYHPVGPELIGMLNTSFVLTGPDEAETFLSAIAGEIDDTPRTEAADL